MTPESRRHLHIFLFFVTLAGAGIGAYAWYDYERVKKINATVVSVQQAVQIIQENSK